MAANFAGIVVGGRNFIFSFFKKIHLLQISEIPDTKKLVVHILSLVPAIIGSISEWQAVVMTHVVDNLLSALKGVCLNP